MGHVLKSKDLSGHTALILKVESCADMIGLQLPKLFSYLTASFAGKLSRFGNHASDFFAKRQHIIDKFWSMILQPWQDILHDVDLLQESNALVVIQLVPVLPRCPRLWRCHARFGNIGTAATTKLAFDHRDEDPQLCQGFGLLYQSEKAANTATKFAACFKPVLVLI